MAYTCQFLPHSGLGFSDTQNLPMHWVVFLYHIIETISFTGHLATI